MGRIIFLSNNDNTKELQNWLIGKGNDVRLISEPITIDMVKSFNPSIVISYNYVHIVREDVIEYLGDRIINMHTSFLPWNKGASPNIWSIIDDTPKGVTIHRLEKGLDTGDVIVQKECVFDEYVDTLYSSYATLNREIVELLQDNWDKIISGNYVLRKQQGKGSYHRTADLEALLAGRHIDYSMTIAEFKNFIWKSDAIDE